MPDPIPPAPNPTPEPIPTPSIRGYVNPWELIKIVLGTIATGGLSFEVAVPLLQKLAESVDLWVVNPSYREPIKLVIGGIITLIPSVWMVRYYFRKGYPVEIEVKERAE